MTEDLPMGSPPSLPQTPPSHTSTVPRSGSPIPTDLRNRVPAIFGGHPPSFMEKRRSSIVMGQRSVDLLMEQPGEPMPRFVIFIIRCYRRWGYFIADHSLKAILICVLISLVCLYFVLTTKTEFSRYQEFFSHDGPGITVYIFALAKDGGNMLRERYLNETVEILNLANENVTLQQNGHNKSFAQFCRSFCKINEPVRGFYNGFRLQLESIAMGNKPNSRINLNYPKSQILGHTFTLQIKMVVLQFRAEHENGWTSEIVKTYEMAMVKRFEKEYKSELLSIGVDSSYLMNHEWQSVIKHCREQPNRKNLNVGYRVSQVLSEVGPAILISMLTNVFADGIGAITSSPEITLLCVGNLISMIIAFIYQMTCYAGLMSLVGETDPDELEAMELEKGINENSDSPQLSETTLDDERSLEIPTGPFKEEDLAVFLRWPEYTQWSGFLKLDNKTGQLERFFFTTGYHGDKLEVWTERGKLLKEWRAVVDKYSPDFDASVFHEDAVFLDLIDNMPSDTWQSVLGTLVCMAFVCFAFLSSMFTVIFASSCVLSICCGILGILSWWSIDLDPIMMAAMIISIGFSVDIPAHVSYHYYQASIRELNATPEMKLVNCLSSVAFPALQAALSTIFCVCSLLFVKLYMAEVFVKTMVLCVVLCNLHGLLFLPAFLIVFDPVVYSCRQRISKSHSKVKSNNRIHNVIPEESGSQESSLKENTLINEKKRKLFNQNGLNKTINNDKQSTITDRPNLERFHSIELEGGGGDKLKQEENEEKMNNNAKDNLNINSKSNQKIDDTSH
uniref:SSD domain-containing protein n=1 Tax=Meloidogyne javanica TaxID=6303 RepID=A0A915N0X2_MELJA